MMNNKEYVQTQEYVLVAMGLEIVGMLEEKHAIKVLLILLKEGPMMKTALYDELDKGVTIALKRVDSLMKAGLLEETVMAVKPFAKTISLTDKGHAIANHLSKVEEILEADA